MKTKYRLWQLTVLFMMTVLCVLHAADVSKDDILNAARKWIADNAIFQAELPGAVPEKATQLTDGDGKAMPLWRVDLQPAGYLVMSSDDTLPPVVAFNTKGSFEKTPAGHPLPDMLKRQGAIFKTELGKPQTRGNELAAENQARWNVLLKRTRADSVVPSTIVRPPMLTTEWNQGAPYNYFCPSGSSYSERAVAGCVPVAIAQILKYYEWPLNSESVASYTDNKGNIQASMLAEHDFLIDWSAMQDSYEWKEEQNYGTSEYAVARLIMEIGVMLKADYELDGTAAFINDIEDVLSDHFEYTSKAILNDYPSSLYSGIRYDIKTQGIPVIVSYDGHTFIADGLGTMDGQDYYHFNYGWGGFCNGWYLLTDGYEGTVITSAVLDIEPSPDPFIKQISEEQLSTFTLEWEFPKRSTAEAFRLERKNLGTDDEFTEIAELPGTARSYKLTGQSGRCLYRIWAKVDGIWQGVSNAAYVEVKDNPIPMLEVTCPDSLKSIAGQPVVFTVTGNHDLGLVNMRSSRPDILPYSGIERTGSGNTWTVTLTPNSDIYGNAVVYLQTCDYAGTGNYVKKAIALSVMPDEPLTWYTDENEASEAAYESGKLVLMVAGRDTCQNTNYFRNTVCETPDVKARLLSDYVLWYTNVDTSSEYYSYAYDLGGTLPFIAIIDPAQQNMRLRGHGGFMSIDEGRLFLNPDVPYFNLDASKTYVNGTEQSLDISVIREGADIYYRLDSNEPTLSDMLYTDEIPLTATTTVSARAFLNRQPISDTVTKTYTFMDQVETPVLNKAQNDYFYGSCTVTAACATPGATIRYTTNGYIPTANSPVFPDGGLTVTEYATIAVMAFKDGMMDSNYAYTILTPLELFQEAQSIVVEGDVTMLTAGNTPWTLQRTTYHSSPSAMQSGTITDNDETVMAAKVTGNGTLSFWWKVSSEQTYDKLNVTIDGVEQDSISGVVDWAKQEYTIAGEGDHYVIWTYAKDVSMSYNSDCGWVDDVSWTQIELASIAISGDATIPTGETATYTCTATWSDGTTSTVTPTWSLSSTSYASVNANGVVTNENSTTSNKTVTLKAAYQGKTASKSITLEKKKPLSVSIEGPDSIAAGDTATYACKVDWSYGPSGTLTSPTWSLDANDYASLEANGVVKNNNTTPRPLTARLNVAYTYDNQRFTDSKSIRLEPVETPDLVSISISGPATISAADTATYTCTATWSDQTTTTVTPIWTVSATTIASVDANGVVTNNNTTTEDKVIRLNAVYEANGVMKLSTKSITLKRRGLVPVSQTLALQSGWNWVSFYMLPNDHTVGNVLGTAGFTANDIIQTDGDSARFTGDHWVMGDFSVGFGKMYQIYVDKGVMVNIAGFPSGQTTVQIQSGWNWVGNPTSSSVPLADLVHSGGWTSGDRIQTAGGESAIYTAGASWVPANFTLEPGKGYQIHAANAGTLTIPSPVTDDALYAVVDLSGGPNVASYPVRYSSTGPDLSDDTCRTTELWLRKIPKGTFTMGSPEDEVGRFDGRESQHQVTLTQDYYIGVFECTQKQWQLVMGSNPASYQGDGRPVEQVSYDMIRGATTTSGVGWPMYGHTVASTSFMGKLQAKTGLLFDLPTEAQWEYACRAGTTTSLNSGTNVITNGELLNTDMNKVGRYRYNQSDGKGGFSQHTKVGSYQPNAWGLYDMHGNLFEWCLDWLVDDLGTASMTDPIGPSSGNVRVVRGGNWNAGASICRSAYRAGYNAYSDDIVYCGFRIACYPKQDLYVVVDLSGGPNVASYPVRYSSTGPDLSDNTCRMTELWLRKIPAGTFFMGSHAGEVGRIYSDEEGYQVTLTQDYYIGVFECTQYQWELVMGDKPSYFNNAEYYSTRPVEQVSYDMIRGMSASAGAGWPVAGHAVDLDSFMGKLRQKTGLTFDLPTEAQWEYACRAATTTALNSGKNLTYGGQDEGDPAMDEVGRYRFNGGGTVADTYEDNIQDCTTEHGTARVGSYLPNAWGLYDMHGNVDEWCLDWLASRYDTTQDTDPVGPATGRMHMIRGGSWPCIAAACRSANRNQHYPSVCTRTIGFRIAIQPRQNLYAVVDLSGGIRATNYPVRYTDVPPNLNDDTCRTTELWLRKIPKGTFIMGSPKDELGRNPDEDQHEVTLTKDFYAGVFECTQKQWELVAGSNPSEFKSDCRPVENVSFDIIRGTSVTGGGGWPTYGHAVDMNSFLSILRAKTGLTFDLPTEEQWEYACRAGTTTALNSGKNLISSNGTDANLAEVGRYYYNQADDKGGYTSGHTKVGSYLPNAWGLYDMHGNVFEWCLDTPDIDLTSGNISRSIRGGNWYCEPWECRSGNYNNTMSSSADSGYGFRLFILP